MRPTVVEVLGADADAAMAELVHRYQADLVRVVTLVCGQQQEAEDAVQDALLALWTAQNRGASVASPKAWLTAACMNRLRSNWRRGRLHGRYLERAGAQLAERRTSPDIADALAVRSALAALPFRQRQAAVLFYLLDLSVDETATAMSTSPGMVKNALFRARRSMAEALGERPLEVK